MKLIKQREAGWQEPLEAGSDSHALAQERERRDFTEINSGGRMTHARTMQEPGKQV